MVGGPATATAQEVLWGLGEADLIVSDLRLSGEDGLWLLEQVNQTQADPGCSCQRRHGGSGSRLLDAPFARQLLKPVDPWDVSQIVADILRRES
jgi:CheY-like chemotaxis protein